MIEIRLHGLEGCHHFHTCGFDVSVRLSLETIQAPGLSHISRGEYASPQVDAASGKEYIIGENIHHGMQIHKETLCLKSRTGGVPAYVADANVCSTFRMHFGHPTSANPKETLCLVEPKRVRRHVAY